MSALILAQVIVPLTRAEQMQAAEICPHREL